MPKNIEAIETTGVLSWSSKVPQGNDAETWIVALSNGKRAFLKLSDEGWKTAAELAASQIGRAFGLKIPRPWFVLVDNQDLPEDTKFPKEGKMIAFASEMLGEQPVSFSTVLNQNSQHAMQLLKSSPTFYQAAAFDELIANEDRNLGNIVVYGKNQELALIDHGQAFQLQNLVLWGTMVPEKMGKNLVIENFEHLLDEATKTTLRNTAIEMALAVDQLDFSKFISNDLLLRLDQNLHREAIISLIRERSKMLVNALCSRIGLHELPLTTR